jgi:hypothetical protein
MVPLSDIATSGMRNKDFELEMESMGINDPIAKAIIEENRTTQVRGRMAS